MVFEIKHELQYFRRGGDLKLVGPEGFEPSTT